MGGSVSAGRNNDELIDHLVEAEFIRTPRVQQVFRAVDRGNYYCPGERHNAYRDMAWKMGNLHLSAPCVYSVVMEALKLEPGLSFLNLGSGTGYLSTMVGLILGPYGINHGIELYQDVVDFAYERLNDFIGNANAIDEYDFCEPSFFVGNCLLLDNSCQQYDRVYCGASCPKEYETYIKDLVKVGGILVMPLNEKLLKMTRTGESTWSTTKVLSVSFAPLITPPYLTEHERAKYTKVGNICPPKLEHICRSNIRAILRKNIDKDYPNLKNKQRRVEIKEVRRIIIPIFDESDLSNSDLEYDSDSSEFTISSQIPSRMSVLLEDFLRRRAESQTAALVIQSHSSSSDNDIKTCNDKENSREDPNNKAISKNKGNSENETNSKDKANSEIKTKSESNTNSEKLTYSASFMSMPDDSLNSNESLPSSSKKLTSDELKQRRNRNYLRSQMRPRRASAIQALKKIKCSSRKRPASDDEGASDDRVISHCQFRARVKRRVSTVLWKRIIPRNPDSEMEEDSKYDNIAKGKDNVEKETEDDDNYTKHMIKRIPSLPLPSRLIKYLNYQRNNL